MIFATVLMFECAFRHTTPDGDIVYCDEAWTLENVKVDETVNFAEGKFYSFFLSPFIVENLDIHV